MNLNDTIENSSDTLRLEPEKDLVKCFNTVQNILKQDKIWKYLSDILISKIPNLSDFFRKGVEDLEKIDCGILVAGETSAGKSTLINRILGEEILVTDVLESTTKIYIIKHSETFQIKTYQRENSEPAVFRFEGLDELRMKLEELEDVEDEERRDKSIYQIDVMIPFEKLKTSVTIVDTPGIGDSKDLKELLDEYVPKAVAFVFVVDVSRAGGLQTDRLVKTMEEIHSRTDVMQCFDPRETLFVRNKWDCVKAKEDRIKRVKSKLTKVLKEIWPCAEENNMYDMALAENVHGGEHSSYSSAYEKFEVAIQDLIKKKENMTIKIHGLFLGDVISKAIFHLTHIKTDLKRSGEGNDIASDVIDKKIVGLSRDINMKQGCAETDVNQILQKLTLTLHDYISSQEFKKTILEAEPDLKSFSRMKIDGEIKKRIKNATEIWIKANIPKIVDGEINSLLKEADNIYQGMRDIKQKLCGISESSDEDSVEFKTVGWSLTGGIFWVVNRAFWAAVIGPQTAMAMSTFWLFSTLAMGGLDITNLMEDAEKVINSSFGKRMKSLDKERLYGIMEERFGKHLQEVHNNIFKQLLPEEIQNLQKSLEVVKRHKIQLTGDLSDLESWLTTLGQVKQEVEDIVNLVS